MKRFVTSMVLASLSLSAPALSQDEDQRSATDRGTSSEKRVWITYHNLTAGQAFSPSVFFSHNEAAPPLFVEGQPASFHLQRIAEEGNVGPLLTMRLTKVSGGAYRHSAVVKSVQPGAQRTFTLLVTEDHPLVTGAFMIAMTNDGFSGIQSVNAYSLDEPMEIDLFAYDAGTENNNELGDFLIAMEGTSRDPENGVVRRHEGLRGDADAPGFWKFDPARPVARITIRVAR